MHACFWVGGCGFVCLFVWVGVCVFCIICMILLSKKCQPVVFIHLIEPTHSVEDPVSKTSPVYNSGHCWCGGLLVYSYGGTGGLAWWWFCG